MNKTFEEFITDGGTGEDFWDGIVNWNVFNNDAMLLPLKENIEEFFGNREILSNEQNFMRFFGRTLSMEWPYYKQMIRIDPKYAELDWFIEEFIATHEVNEYTGTKAETTEGGKITEGSTQHDINVQTQYSGGHTITLGGNDTLLYEGQEQETGNSNNTRTYNGGSNVEEKGSESTATTNDRITNGNSRAYGYAKSAPMSEKSGKGTISITPSNGAGTGKDLSNGLQYPDMSNYSSATDATNLNSEGVNSKATDTKTFNGRITETRYEGRSDVDAGDTTNTRSYVNRADKTQYGRTETDTFNERNDHKTGIESDTTNSTESTTGNTTTQDASRDSRKLLHSGRHELPSEVIQRAAEAIQNTRAWNYMYNALNKCFILTYDIYGEED